MPDKSQETKSATRRQRPKQPPKEPQQDYSALPQKPIKLKQDVSLPDALKTGTAKSKKTSRRKPTVKKKTENTASRRRSVILEGISQEAKTVATASAENEGVTLDHWLENLILDQHRAKPAVPKESLEMIARSLRQIEQRLERLENQRGFWSRFWDQFMEPLRRQ
jgi:hypothetical protein